MENIFVHETSEIDQNCLIGEGTKIWHFSHIMEKSIIGKNCNIGQNVVVSPFVNIGDNVKIQNNVSVYTGVEIHNNVFIGPSVVFTNIKNPRSEINRRNEYVKTLLKEGATLGANSTIICGVTIGKYALIGAGTVVTKDIKDYALVIGNPGKQVGWVSEFGHKLHFTKGIAICKESKQKYLLKNNLIVKDE